MVSWQEVVPREGVRFLRESGAIGACVLVTAGEKLGPSQPAGGWQKLHLLTIPAREGACILGSISRYRCSGRITSHL